MNVHIFHNTFAKINHNNESIPQNRKFSYLTAGYFEDKMHYLYFKHHDSLFLFCI